VLGACFLALEVFVTASAADAPSVPAELRGAMLIDSVVARVDRHPITRSQLELETRLALARHGEEAKAEAALGGAQLQASLDYLIDQILLDDEAERLGVFEVTEDEGRSEIQKLAKGFSSPEAYQTFLVRFGLTPDLIEGSLRRSLRAERYLADKLRIQAQSGATPDQLQTAARALVSQLRSRADIRVLVHYGDGPTAARPDAGLEMAPAARALTP
jgi:SurA N-terminal domain